MAADVPAILPNDQGKLLGDSGLPDILPSSIATDETMRCIASAIEMEIRRHVQTIPTVLLWPAINILTEPVLTHLAVMLHADWWDNTWSLPAKRAFLFRQVMLHRKKGTPWAVEEAVSLVYGTARLREWYQYGGDRGCFTLEVDVLGSGLSDDEIAKIEMMVRRYKRKSQHLCGMRFGVSSRGALYVGVHNIVDETITVRPFVPPEITLEPVETFKAAATDIVETITVDNRI